MNEYRNLTKEEKLVYLINFYKKYLTIIKLELKRLEHELEEERNQTKIKYNK